jgi:hypothetical protein
MSRSSAVYRGLEEIDIENAPQEQILESPLLYLESNLQEIIAPALYSPYHASVTNFLTYLNEENNGLNSEEKARVQSTLLTYMHKLHDLLSDFESNLNWEDLILLDTNFSTACIRINNKERNDKIISALDRCCSLTTILTIMLTIVCVAIAGRLQKQSTEVNNAVAGTMGGLGGTMVLSGLLSMAMRTLRPNEKLHYSGEVASSMKNINTFYRPTRAAISFDSAPALGISLPNDIPQEDPRPLSNRLEKH